MARYIIFAMRTVGEREEMIREAAMLRATSQRLRDSIHNLRAITEQIRQAMGPLPEGVNIRALMDVPQVRRAIDDVFSSSAEHGVLPGDGLLCMVYQGGKCAICETDIFLYNMRQRPVLDHDHRSGKPRGFLCNTCNIRLGHIENGNPISVPKYPFINYLAKSPFTELRTNKVLYKRITDTIPLTVFCFSADELLRSPGTSQ